MSLTSLHYKYYCIINLERESRLFFFKEKVIVECDKETGGFTYIIFTVPMNSGYRKYFEFE